MCRGSKVKICGSIGGDICKDGNHVTIATELRRDEDRKDDIFLEELLNKSISCLLRPRMREENLQHLVGVKWCGGACCEKVSASLE
jgi:hypothetical protein